MHTPTNQVNGATLLNVGTKATISDKMAAGMKAAAANGLTPLR